MPPAARVTDMTDHLGELQRPGVTTVTIGGLAAAVAMTTMHRCNLPSNPPHPTLPIAKGSTTVTIGGLAAARIGDQVGCGAAIATGSATVTIGD